MFVELLATGAFVSVIALVGGCGIDTTTLAPHAHRTVAPGKTPETHGAVVPRGLLRSYALTARC